MQRLSPFFFFQDFSKRFLSFSGLLPPPELSSFSRENWTRNRTSLALFFSLFSHLVFSFHYIISFFLRLSNCCFLAGPKQLPLLCSGTLGQQLSLFFSGAILAGGIPSQLTRKPPLLLKLKTGLLVVVRAYCALFWWSWGNSLDPIFLEVRGSVTPLVLEVNPDFHRPKPTW